MSNNFRNGFSFGVFMSILLITRGLLTTDTLFAINVIGIIVSALIGGAVGGLVFAWVVNKILSEKQKKLQGGVKSQNVENE